MFLKVKSSFFLALAMAVLFALIFYHQQLGYNVPIFTAALLLAHFGLQPALMKKTGPLLSGLLMLLTSFLWALHAQFISLLALCMSYAFLVTYSLSPEIRNFAYAALQMPLAFLMQLGSLMSWKDEKKVERRKGIVWAIPLVLFVLFGLLYAGGSDLFAERASALTEAISTWFTQVFGQMDVLFLFLLVLGLLLSSILLIRERSTALSKADAHATDALMRERKPFRASLLALKTEYRTAYASLLMLNLLLAFVIYLEIRHVWFGFEWKGEMLKSMVHQGTWSLIISVFLSIALSAWFFRKNLNFYPDGGRLKRLVYLWIALNFLLVASVAIRNYWYIWYFALAYKRIGVYFFLILCVFGLSTLWMKMQALRSTYFLLRCNSAFFLVAFSLLGVVNWETTIARYNMSKGDCSFIHVPFMLSLSNQALPFLQRNETELDQLDSLQTKAIPFREPGYFEAYNFRERINERSRNFLKEWPDKPFLSKTFAGERAYKRLKKQIQPAPENP